MFRALAIVAALAGLAHAAPDAVKRKATPSTDKFAKAAAEAFAAAIVADDKNDLPTALAMYQKAQAIAPHPSTAYNIADIQRRMGRIEPAIEGFETYLAMYPAAPDRKECEAIIDGLSSTPGTLYITTAESSDVEALAFKDFYFLVDGEIKVKPGTQGTPQKEIGGQLGIAIPMPPGKHSVDAVSAITYGSQSCEIHPGRYEVCRIRAKPRIDGRLVIRSGDRDVHATMAIGTDRDKGLYDDRVEVTPGKRKLAIRDRSFECTALPIDVPNGASDIVYVFMQSKEYDGFQRCRKLDIHQHKLHFD